MKNNQGMKDVLISRTRIIYCFFPLSINRGSFTQSCCMVSHTNSNSGEGAKPKTLQSHLSFAVSSKKIAKHNHRVLPLSPQNQTDTDPNLPFFRPSSIQRNVSSCKDNFPKKPTSSFTLVIWSSFFSSRFVGHAYIFFSLKFRA